MSIDSNLGCCNSQREQPYKKDPFIDWELIEQANRYMKMQEDIGIEVKKGYRLVHPFAQPTDLLPVKSAYSKFSPRYGL